jgi:GLPGLI family protein
MKYISLVLLISLSATVAAQDTAPVAMGKITYKRHTNLQGHMPLDGNTTLFFHPDRSLFVHNDAPTNSRTIKSQPGGGIDISFGDSTGFPVLKLHHEKKIWFKDYIPFTGVHEISVIRDTFGTTVWTIDATQTRTIGGFTCEKATGHYRGRDYEVWYTPDIPIPSGPFKLGGLPGLIMEARSTDGNVQFLFTGIEFPLKETIKIAMPPGGRTENMNFAQVWEFTREKSRQMEREALAEGVIMEISQGEIVELNTNN